MDRKMFCSKKKRAENMSLENIKNGNSALIVNMRKTKGTSALMESEL